jgi:hypothetical protein
VNTPMKAMRLTRKVAAMIQSRVDMNACMPTVVNKNIGIVNNL